MLTRPPAHCCDFGGSPQHRYVGPLPVNYTDCLGFTYRLCDRHYVALVAGLEWARRPDARPIPRGGYAHRRYPRACPG